MLNVRSNLISYRPIIPLPKSTQCTFWCKPLNMAYALLHDIQVKSNIDNFIADH